MSGQHKPPLGDVEHRRAVRGDILEQQLPVCVDVLVQYLGQAGVSHLPQLLRFAVEERHFACHVQQDHRHGVAAHWPCAGDGLLTAGDGCIGPFDDLPVEFAGDTGGFLVAGDEVVADGGYDDEGLGEYLARHRQRLALAGEAEVGPPALVERVLHDEIPAHTRHLKPFLALLDRVAECGEEPRLAGDRPHVLVRPVGCAVVVKHMEETAVFAVGGVLQPEGDDVVEEHMLVVTPECCDFRGIHEYLAGLVYVIGHDGYSALCASVPKIHRKTGLGQMKRGEW